MIQTEVSGWSMEELEVAQSALQLAYQREIQALLAEVKSRSAALTQIEELWHLHDFLSARRHDIDGKYDFDYASLLFAFAKLIKDGWLQKTDLVGLDQGKLAKITALTRM